MSRGRFDKPEPPRPQKGAPDDSLPQTLLERQRSLSGYLLRRIQQRRDRFLRRAAAFSLSKELARSAYLAGCVLFDSLVVPEPIRLFPSPWAWAVFFLALIVAIWTEVRVYAALFSLRESPVVTR